MSVLTFFNVLFYNYFNPIIALLGMIGLLLYWIIKKHPASYKITKIIFWIVLASIIFQSLYLSITHILMWSATTTGRAFLPPLAPWSYSLHYVFIQYCKRNLFTILSSLLFVFVVNYLNKRFKERFFYKEEIYLMGLGLLWNPWPGLVVLIITLLFTFLIIQVINLLFSKHKRLSMLYLWLPCSLLSFFITYAILRHIPFLNLLFV